MTSEPVAEPVADAEPAAEQHHVSVEEGVATSVAATMTPAEIEAARAEQEAPPEMTGGSINPPAPPVQTPFMTAAPVEHAGQVTGGWNNPSPGMVTVEQQEQQAAAEKAAREAAGEPEPEPTPEPEPAPPPDPASVQPGTDVIGALQQAGELPPSPKPDSTIEELQEAQAAAIESQRAEQAGEHPQGGPPGQTGDHPQGGPPGQAQPAPTPPPAQVTHPIEEPPPPAPEVNPLGGGA